MPNSVKGNLKLLSTLLDWEDDMRQHHNLVVRIIFLVLLLLADVPLVIGFCGKSHLKTC